MNFVRKKRRGQNQKTHKTWFSEDGHYRVNWRKEVEGVQVEPAYHACVRCINREGFEHWGFAGARRPFRTFNKAVEACETNRKLWEAALAETRLTKFRELDLRARAGTGPTFARIFMSLPIWVRRRDSPRLLDFLYPKGKQQVVEEWETVPMNDQASSTDTSISSPAASESPTAPTEASTSSVESTSVTEPTSGSKNAPTNGRASRAQATDGSSTPKTRQPRKKATTAQGGKSPAKPAKGRASGAAKSAGKSTGTKSASGKKPAKSSTGSKNSGTKPSKSSPKKSGKR